MFSRWSSCLLDMGMFRCSRLFLSRPQLSAVYNGRKWDRSECAKSEMISVFWCLCLFYVKREISPLCQHCKSTVCGIPVKLLTPGWNGVAPPPCLLKQANPHALFDESGTSYPPNETVVPPTSFDKAGIPTTPQGSTQTLKGQGRRHESPKDRYQCLCKKDICLQKFKK